MATFIEVEMPDGSIAEFPSNMSDKEISAAIRKTFQPQQKESFLKQATRGPRNLGAGVNKLIRKAANVPSDLARLMGDQESADILSVMKDYDIDAFWGLPKPEQQHWSDQLVQAGPEIAGAFLLPEAELGELGALLNKIPKGGKYLSKILSQGAPQAAYSAALAPEGQRAEAAGMTGAVMAPFSVASQLAQSTSPLARRFAQGIGAVGGYELGKHGAEALGASPIGGDIAGIALGGLGARGFTSQNQLRQKLTEGMKPEVVQERMEAARRLGLDYLTPAEASLNPYIGAKQGALANTPEGSALMYQKAKSRVGSEEKAINDLLETIYSGEKMKPLQGKLYDEAKQTLLPPDFIEKFKDNEIVKQAAKDISTSAAYKEQLKNVPKDSVEYWDLIKEAIYDLEEKAPKRESKLYSNTRRKLVEEIDKVEPRYKEARAFAERKITREKLEKAFDRTDPSGKSFFKVLASKEKFDKLQHNLRNVPEAQARLKDMRMLFGDLISPPTIRGAAALEKTSMSKARSSMQAATDMIGNALSKGKYDKEMIEFITDPNWDAMMKDLNKISNKQERMSKFLEYFGKSMAQEAGKQND